MHRRRLRENASDDPGRCATWSDGTARSDTARNVTARDASPATPRARRGGWRASAASEDPAPHPAVGQALAPGHRGGHHASMTNPSSPRDDAEAFRSAFAIRDAIPTRVHAEMVFAQVVDLLGELAWVETWNGAQARSVYRRETPGSQWIVPWPLASVSRGGREGPSPIMTGIPGVYREPTVRPGRAPKLRDLGPGQLALYDGPQRVTVSCGKDGRWFECSVSSPPEEALRGVLPALAARSAAPAELVSSFVAGLDVGRHGPGRVLLPVPLPGGVQGAWNCGLFAIRDELFRNGLPPGGGFIAADGWTGRAVTSGAERESTVEGWRRVVANVRPFPEKPKAPPEPLPEPGLEQSFEDGHFAMRATLTGPKSDVAWVEPTVQNSPAALVALTSPPAGPPPIGDWTCLVDTFGNVRPAALRRDRDGFTLIGGRVLDTLDLAALDALDARLDAADRDWEVRAAAFPKVERPPGVPEPPPTDCDVRTYRVVDDRTRAPVKPSLASAGRRRDRGAEVFDPAQVDWQVVRLRRDRT